MQMINYNQLVCFIYWINYLQFLGLICKQQFIIGLFNLQIEYKFYKHLSIYQNMGCSVSQQQALPYIRRSIKINSSRYHQTELIAINQHAKIYKCIKEGQVTEYAMKIISLNNGGKELVIKAQQFQRSFSRREKGLNSKLLQFIEIQIINNELCMIMELGKYSLKAQIQRQGKLSQEKTSIITHSILLGLEQLYRLQSLYKNWKTSNIIYIDDSYKISDYSLDQIYQQLQNTSQSKKQKSNHNINLYKYQSFPYLAPQVIKKKGFCKQSDIWSMGCIVIEILTGTKSKVDLNYKNSNILPQLPKCISKQCKQFLNSCLNINPTKRLKIDDLLVHTFIKKYQNLAKNPRKSNNFSQQKQNKIFDSCQNGKQKPYNNALSADRQSVLVQQLNVLQNLTNHKQNYGKEFAPINGANQNQEHLYVYINNEKRRLDRGAFKIKHTQKKQFLQNRNFRNSIEFNSPNTSRTNQALTISKAKMETEPFIINLQINRQIFKKPLKLLKKKLQKKKESKEISNDSVFSMNLQLKNLHNQYEKPHEIVVVNEQINRLNKKKRSITQDSRQLIVINTHIAQAQRDRHMVQQSVMRRQRQADRAKWQQELKKQAQAYKRQFAYRYGFNRSEGIKN